MAPSLELRKDLKDAGFPRDFYAFAKVAEGKTALDIYNVRKGELGQGEAIRLALEAVGYERRDSAVKDGTWENGEQVVEQAEVTKEEIKTVNTAQSNNDPGSQLTALIEQIARKGLDEAQVREVVKDELSKLQLKPDRTDYYFDGVKTGTVKGSKHKLLDTLVKDYHIRRKANQRLNFFLAGPAGSGKSYLCGQLAEAIGKPHLFEYVSLSEGVNESVFKGRVNPLNAAEKVSTPFIHICREGGVFLIDEVGAGDANCLMTLNYALASGEFKTAWGESVVLHPETVLVGAANTFGQTSAKYQSANKLDYAFMDRFTGGMFYLDFDRDLEASLVDDSDFLNRMWAIRDLCRSNKLEKDVSTRNLVTLYPLFAAVEKRTGNRVYTWADIFDKLTIAWTDQERAKVASIRNW